jgi:hypothetical protein
MTAAPGHWRRSVFVPVESEPYAPHQRKRVWIRG